MRLLSNFKQFKLRSDLYFSVMKKLAGFFGASAVILGAIGAHTLQPHLTETALASYKTGVLYHLVHALGLLAISNKSFPKWIGTVWSLGIVLFSFSIYLLATDDLLGIKLNALGPITPIGGLLLVAGWIGVFLTKEDSTH